MGDTVIHSTDSDLFCILANVCSYTKFPPSSNVYLRYWGDKWADIKALSPLLSVRYGSVRNFITMAIICGTDFFLRCKVFNYIGPKKLMPVMMSLIDDIYSIEDGAIHFVRIIRTVYGKLWKIENKRRPGRPPSLAVLRDESARRNSDGKNKRAFVPDKEAISHCYQMLCFNLSYWCIDWSKIPTSPIKK
jgi:hypothetical protein